MASKVNGLIQKINPGNNTEYSIASTAYGYCQTAAGTTTKVCDMTGFTLLEGATIHVKFQYANTASSPTLNVNGTGAKPIVQYGTTAAGTTSSTSGWYAGAILSLTYDGTSWVRDQGFNSDTNTVTTVTTNGSGNAITAISATNGAITATKGTTFLTSHQDISGKADKSATVSTVVWDSTNKKITKTINGTTSDVVQFVANGGVTLTGESGKLTISSSESATAFEIPVLFGSGGWYIPSTIKGTDILDHINNCYLMIDGYGRTEINNYLIDSSSPPGPNIQLFAKAYDDVYYFGTEYTMFKVIAAGNSTNTPTVEALDFTQTMDGDRRVYQSYSTTNASYPLLLTSISGISNTSSRGAYEAILNNSIYANPSTGTVTATTFSGALSGNATTATTATKLGTDNKGSGTKPIYLAAGVPTECSTYAGGTAVTLNGTSKAASTASFYAPTSAGTTNQILVSGGSSTAPSWKATANGAAYATSSNGALTFGTLPVAQGGTGATSFTANRIIMSGNTTTAALTTRAVTNNTSNTAITNNNTNIPTMNTIYYGLVGVNGSSQSRATTIYAPTSAGTSGQLLKSNGSGAPGWITTSIGSSMQPIYLSSGAPTACTIPSSGAWWSAVPQILSDGVMEVGKYIDFHTTSNGTTNYDVRITAATTGLTISGTTVGTFSGDLSGNAATATILKSQNTASTATTEVSSWYTPTDWKHVWGQRFKDTSISTDTGDICFKLSPVYTYDSSGTLTGTNSSQSQLFMMIDGGIHIQNTSGETSPIHDCEKRNVPLMIGAPHYAHMEFDSNEIIVKTSDTAMGTLWLNDQLGILANGFISRAGFGTTWLAGRTGAVVRTSSCPNGSYCTIYSVKTGRGSWECGTYNYNNGDNLYWTYIKDSRTANGDDGQAWLAPGGEYHATKVWGAVYNDYAEMRNVPEAQNEDNPLRPGTCVREVGDGTMIPTIERLQRGCKIISDTFGFNIGETDNCKTPIAVSGRALVYLDQDREVARDYIGWPVCSGPNGTVSIMTEEEEEKYPSRIVGTISEIPDYEKWGSSDVEVNGRIWIYVR